ncbi:glycoside hydrolase family 15 protein [Trebonia kvetii]|uniref:Glycoside hydrolase family 15 protein n=1 Tax=Trebonia kvetii TaxID=2480626 RepID=A0A6P2BN66_9ACTN|nr:glycoside hydrolase family 15 protein [Trebonia kvetii]TVZ00410.1 glycoside hydrolase family 15 protein [Trebonia kvetii]
MDRYPDISEHGLIGDLQTAALVTSDGTVDFFCCPRFDSPSVFASLVDAERGGHFSIKPAADGYVTKQLYFPDTAMLITRFMTKDGVGEVLDFMPVIEGAPTDRHRLVRHLRVARGTMRFELQIQPRFNYGRAKHTVELAEEGAVFRADDGMVLTLHVAGMRETPSERAKVEQAGDGLRAVFEMREGESGRGVMLESAGGKPKAMTAAELDQMADDTAAYWKSWVGRSTYQGRWREMVSRSAMTLKLLTYEPTGAPVAAATFGLPEQTGGERNWDYRFTWIRDGSLTMHALANLGYLVEAGRFNLWLRDRVAEQAGSASGPLKIMYRVDGTSDLVEETLEHFEGWRGSRPVRIGNGAADQLQLDIYGEALDALYYFAEQGAQIGHRGWQELSQIVDWVADNWDQPDEGVWETRGGRKDFTYGRFQCWVALDRAIRLAGDTGRPSNLAKWVVERDRLYNQIMDRGWNKNVGAFTQHYSTDVLDSALLFMPLEGFVAPQDPMWQSTLRAMDKQLVSDSLVYRYNPAASPDGLHGDEGTFSLCTFLYVDALARSGRLDDAILTFEKMQTYGNHLGLFSEEIGPTGDQLGNFPQAFTHLSLINSALTLNRELERRAAHPERIAAIEQLAASV